VGGTINVSGANLDDDASCAPGFTTTLLLSLGPLANNGGPTQTHALLAGSSAINAVPSGQCTDLSSTPAPVTQDQRGVVRPAGSACDVGAFEASGDMVANTPTVPFPLAPGGSYSLSFSCTNNGPDPAFNATCTIAASSGSVSGVNCTPSNPPVSSLPANGVLSCNYTFTAPGMAGGADDPLGGTNVTFTVTTAADDNINPGNDTAASIAVPILDAVNDAVSLPAGLTAQTYNLASNDQLGTSGPPPSGFTMQVTTCSAASVTLAGMATFDVPASGTCTLNYRLCLNNACDNATLTVTAVEPIPTLDRWGLLALLACLGTAGVLLLRRVVA
jgi:hypothetical protein